MQDQAAELAYGLEDKVMASGDEEIVATWRELLTSDHFYYMCTKWFSDGDVHKYFNPYETPHQAFITYMNALNDLALRLEGFPRARGLGDWLWIRAGCSKFPGKCATK